MTERSALNGFQSLDGAFSEWDRIHPDAPLIVIYSAGGGIRAAYWTAAVLGRLQNAVPRFPEYVFAVSGVSGGSVGASIWNAAQTNSSGACCVLDEWKTGKRADAIREALGIDHLAPVVAAMTYGDLFHAVVPLSTSDRSVALERSLEASYADSLGVNSMAQGFHSLWANRSPGTWRPLLLLNGTHQETGRRIITAPFPIHDKEFPYALDFFQLFEREIRLSTATLNSARFTYVSPAGRITSRNGCNQGHVVDGGYFENYGARTANDLISAIRLHPHFANHQLIVIEIVNDTKLSAEDLKRVDEWTDPPNLHNPNSLLNRGISNELVAPLTALMGARESRGVTEAKLISKKSASSGNEAKTTVSFFQLPLCSVASGKAASQDPPLGWVLSEESKQRMDQLVEQTVGASDCENILTQSLQKIESLLGD